MAVTVIPFEMPDPMEIPGHIVDSLRQMPADDAVKKGMELLLEIDAAETIIYERVDEEGTVQVQGVVSLGDQGDELAEGQQQELSGKPTGTGGKSLAAEALSRQSALLIMGQAEAGEEVPLPTALTEHVLDGSGAGNVGFLYVLTLAAADGRPLGGLTLVRPPASGPLNHEQPNITEGLRRLLCGILGAR